jgi:hypothetical protein
MLLCIQGDLQTQVQQAQRIPKGVFSRSGEPSPPFHISGYPGGAMYMRTIAG